MSALSFLAINIKAPDGLGVVAWHAERHLFSVMPKRCIVADEVARLSLPEVALASLVHRFGRRMKMSQSAPSLNLGRP